MNDDAFTLLLERLARIETQNDAQLELLHKHLDDDSQMAKTVATHSSLFKIIGTVLTGLLGTLLVKLGWK